ncbi:type IVB secretion system protein IcmH/DotU [Pseudomonas cremoricolorata]|uniref:type IVB secretion system protein IcmH/DotU n=1 Tax=Pseudomonas cremoricolorata TaxID=157783 RepID=UPI00040DDFB8|nr:type IVB secretion system protein IcmH/DotU [Pseudomonas cremoricolorata]
MEACNGAQIPSDTAQATETQWGTIDLTGSDQKSPRESVDDGYPADPQFQLRGTHANKMLDAALPLLGLVMRLRTLDSLPNISAVHQQVIGQINNIREEMRQQGYDPAQLVAYSYVLCLHIDEAVMERPWGRSSCWSQEPLLSLFHDETWGGEKVFTVLGRLMHEPERFQDVLEFTYFALCLGLKGKYAIAPKGEETLNSLIHQLHGIIRERRGPPPQEVCAPYANVAPRNFRMHRRWPWWSPLVICALVMALAYGSYSHRLHQITTEVLGSLNGILLQ